MSLSWQDGITGLWFACNKKGCKFSCTLFMKLFYNYNLLVSSSLIGSTLLGK
jgi:hypothetical protein